jgi:alginate O-acetyltransferase complex protein AlgI
MALLIGLSIVAVFWRLRAASARLRLLLVGTLIGSLLLTWQAVATEQALPISIGLSALNIALVAFTLWSINRRHWRLALIVLIGLFVFIKWPGLIDPQSVTWLGASYLLFRLLHLIFESRKNQLPPLDFKATLIYALFPPALIAGPIDRLPRFQTDLDQIAQPFRADFIAEGAWRILIGAFKKFVLADFLAHLPPDLAHYPNHTPAPLLWLMLYAYGFRLYFDFSGYTDLALGAARLLGFNLPDNFNAPYLKTNLARFWQAWHITLSAWARDYVFFPLARSLRLKATWLPSNGAALISHLATMLVIGLWHGFAWTFVVWGAWHGAGLFIVKVWGDFTRAHHLKSTRAITVFNWFVTFNFVMLGWVFFSARDVPTALEIVGRLLGAGR